MRALRALLLLLPAAGLAAGHRANPIRRVVELLQGLQKEVEEEGRKEKDLYDKFMCYCKSNDGQLKKDTASQEARSTSSRRRRRSSSPLMGSSQRRSRTSKTTSRTTRRPSLRRQGPGRRRRRTSRPR